MPEPTVITGAQIIDGLRKLGREHPDGRGDSDHGGGCRYFYPPDVDPLVAPSCGVGHVLHSLGVRGLPENLEIGFENWPSVLGWEGRFTDSRGHDFTFNVKADEVAKISAFQERQDSGSVWGMAVNELESGNA